MHSKVNILKPNEEKATFRMLGKFSDIFPCLHSTFSPE